MFRALLCAVGGMELSEEEVMVGERLTVGEAEEVLGLLARDGELAQLLAEAQSRAEQHRENFSSLQVQQGRILHQVRVMEEELGSAEEEKLELR